MVILMVIQHYNIVILQYMYMYQESLSKMFKLDNLFNLNLCDCQHCSKEEKFRLRINLILYYEISLQNKVKA